ncbi:vWA domain-containing protein [Candidatus Poriferisodalis sp.]|uniref:vWA domain-containing protein n=1 Tax=Candidatus Poriferisodalis sp. TaxID=3101277 RepID=UPI003B5B9A44
MTTGRQVRARRGAAAVAMAIGLLLTIVPLGSTAAAQGADASGYSPCRPGQSIDLLVMMDASGSLHQSDGVDRDGAKRRTALRDFRARLADLTADLQGADGPEIRLALWRFDRSAQPIVGFQAPSPQHPSNSDIELSLGDPNGLGGFLVKGRYTDYLTALREAAEAFSDGAQGSCRLLLFFTDGIYGPTGEPSLQQANQLRSEVCNDIKRSFEEASIDTYTILLGNQFRDVGGLADPEAPDALKIEMATASMQVLRALTGDASSRLVSGLPYASEFDCAQWSDEQPADRDGAIIAIDDLDRLAVQLLEVVDVAANSLAEWTNCGLASVGDRRSAPLPAGRLIDSIVAYPRATSIEGYEIVTADGVLRREPGTGTEPLRLTHADLAGLEPGWTIEFVTSGGDGGVDVACYIKQASSDVPIETGRVTDAEGQTLESVERSEFGPDSPPLEIQIVAEAPIGLCAAAAMEHFAWPDGRVQDWFCRDDGTVVFELKQLECQGVHELTAPLVVEFEPKHAATLFGPEQVVVRARIDIEGPSSVSYECFGAPVLSCRGADVQIGPVASDGDRPINELDEQELATGQPRMRVEPDTVEVPREHLRGNAGCVFHPPTRGTAEVALSWRPDGTAVLPGDLAWRFDKEFHGDASRGTVSGTGTSLLLGVAGDSEGVVLHFVTADELVNGDWEIGGLVTLVPSWDPGDGSLQAGADRQMASQTVELRVDQHYVARSNSALAFWLTLLLLILSIVISYVLYCTALVLNMSLPDPASFWMYRADIGVDADARGRLTLGSGAQSALVAANSQRIRGDASRGGRGKRTMEWYAAGLRLTLRRSPRLWLPGLLRGAWSEVRSDSGEPMAARPAASRRSRRTSTASAAFTTLVAVGAPRRSPDGELLAPTWIALPRHGLSADIERVDVREVEGLLVQVAAEVPGDGNGEPPGPQGRDDSPGGGGTPPPGEPLPSDPARGSTTQSDPEPRSSRSPADGAADRRGDRPPPRQRPDRPPPRPRPR